MRGGARERERDRHETSVKDRVGGMRLEICGISSALYPQIRVYQCPLLFKEWNSEIR